MDDSLFAALPLKRPREDDEVAITQPIIPHPVPTSQYRYAMICSSNINRSMEAHTVLQNEGYNVESYGCGRLSSVRQYVCLFLG
jgi:hypothetical protein